MQPPSLQDPFDAAYGTDTGGVVPLWRLTIPSRNAGSGVHYATVRECDVRALLAPCPTSATFVDLGCGKGRVLCIAAMMGFAKVIGVEFAPTLADIAERNLARLGLGADVVRGDVVDFVFPSGQLVVYLYNPFDRPITLQVSEALKARGGECWVIYVNPRFAEVFELWMSRLAPASIESGSFDPAFVAIFHHAGEAVRRASQPGEPEDVLHTA